MGVHVCRFIGGRSKPGAFRRQRRRALFSGMLGAIALVAVSSRAAAQVPLPARIEAEDFDAGPNGSAYFDTTAGNAGGEYRNTDVDIQSCAEGGYNIGWSRAGEWLN